MAYDIKKWLNGKTTVTGASVFLLLTIGSSAISQFNLYVPIPIENALFILIFVFIVLISKRQDELKQEVLSHAPDRVQITEEFKQTLIQVKSMIEKFFEVERSRKGDSEPKKPEWL